MKTKYHTHDGVKGSHPVSSVHKDAKALQAHNIAIGKSASDKVTIKVPVAEVTKSMIYVPITDEGKTVLRLNREELNVLLRRSRAGEKLFNLDNLKVEFTEEQLEDILGAMNNARAQQIGVSLRLK